MLVKLVVTLWGRLHNISKVVHLRIQPYGNIRIPELNMNIYFLTLSRLSKCHFSRSVGSWDDTKWQKWHLKSRDRVKTYIFMLSSGMRILLYGWIFKRTTFGTTHVCTHEQTAPTNIKCGLTHHWSVFNTQNVCRSPQMSLKNNFFFWVGDSIYCRQKRRFIARNRWQLVLCRTGGELNN